MATTDCLTPEAVPGLGSYIYGVTVMGMLLPWALAVVLLPWALDVVLLPWALAVVLLPWALAVVLLLQAMLQPLLGRRPLVLVKKIQCSYMYM